MAYRVDRPCDYCATTYTAKTARSRFCSVKCRTRNHERPDLARVVPLEPAPTAPERDVRGPVAAATFAELSAHDRQDTALGLGALNLASALDNPAETGSARAALHRQWTVAMDQALEGVARANDPLDQLAERRARRLG